MSEAAINWSARIFNGDLVEVAYTNAYAPTGLRGEVVARYATSALRMLEIRGSDGVMYDVPLVAVSKIAGVGIGDRAADPPPRTVESVDWETPADQATVIISPVGSHHPIR